MDTKIEWSANWSDKSFSDLKKVVDNVKKSDDYSFLCSTHLDVLNDVINIAKIKNVLEFGGGYWSTSLFLNKCESVMTIEQGQNVPMEDNVSWEKKLEVLYEKNPRWNYVISPGPESWKNLKFNKCEMVFIDGFPSSRFEILQYFIDHECPIIVAHDTEHDGFDWSKVDIKEYKRIDYCGYEENKTSLWTKDQLIINEILKLSNYVLINRDKVRVFEKSLKKIISFSLWGENSMYWKGALENIRLAKLFYPGWVCRFYVDEEAPTRLIKMISEADCEMILMKPSEEFAGLFWRFYAAEDADIMICRNTHSRLSQREVNAVNEWLDSDKHFHIMRDHFEHHILILGGMWGARNLVGITDLIKDYPYKNLKDVDQLFLAELVYPQVKEFAMIHDSYSLFSDGGVFPSERIGDEFVGSLFDENEKSI